MFLNFIKNIFFTSLMFFFFTSCSFFIKKAVINSEGMLPTIKIGDQVTYTSSFDSLNYADLVIFEFIRNDDMISTEGSVIFRIVGLPGDSIAIENHICIINGKKNHCSFVQKIKNKECYVEELEYLNECEEIFPNGEVVSIYCHDTKFSNILSDVPVISIPEDHYFLMGDFRSNAYDSRYLGVIPKDKIIGKIIKIKS